MTQKFDAALIDEKAQKLQEVANQLKSELFGMDEIIDKIINSIRAWYTFPQLIQRPVIVNLWGLTGVGKTQVVRRLAQLLEFSDKFVEVQMDGVSSSASNHETTIVNILTNSAIEECEPGILLLDEFQRYRTVDGHGEDIKIERFQDVWMLLSDGKFSANSGMFREIEMMLAYQAWEQDSKKADEDELHDIEEPEQKGPFKKKRKFQIYPWEARNLKRQLKLTETVAEIMTWNTTKLMEVVEDVKKNKVGLQLDYTKLLVFISGNLDEAYRVSQSVNDCDTDADIFYEMTKKISVTEIKKSLTQRFKPEQISRLGNNHIIYPSIKKETYERLIASTCQRYLDEMNNITGIQFGVDKDALDEIYQNGVYPAQGTRPVFSSVHKIFSDALVQIAFWAIKNSHDNVVLTIDGPRSVLVGYVTYDDGVRSVEIPVDLDIREKRKGATDDFKTTVAVHEAGHALVYALLFGVAPAEIKVNAASFSGGFMMPPVNSETMLSRRNVRDRICVAYAGLAAEEIVFGRDDRTHGSASDIASATSLAAEYVRRWAMEDGITTFIGSPVGHDPSGGVGHNTNLDPTNKRVDSICISELARAKQLLDEHNETYKKLVNLLIAGDTMSAEQFVEKFPELKLSDTMTSSRITSWNTFNERS